MLQLRASAFFSLCLLLFSCVVTTAASADARCFPSEFLLGSSATSPFVPGRSSIWDDYCSSHPELQCANAADGRGLSTFRFSLSWSKVMRWDVDTNKMLADAEGLALYHNLLDDLQKRGAQAIVTLYHIDLPSQLEPNGWLDPDIVTHFEDFAALAFREYGRKVKYWATFNEPLRSIGSEYGSGPDTNMYTAAHNVLRSHAKAVALFRELKRGEEVVVDANARIGIALNVESGDPVDVAAMERKLQFDLGWLAMPLITGDYSEIMRQHVGESLPQFSSEEAAMVKGSYDVFLLIHGDTRALSDAQVLSVSSSQCSGYAEGLFATIKWLHGKDPSTDILLTENEACGMTKSYVKQVYTAVVEDKIPIVGYMASFKNNKPMPRLGLQAEAKPHTASAAMQWFAHLSTTKCLDGWELPTDTDDKAEAAAPREKLLDPEAGGDGVGVPWTLSEVIILLVVGVVVLGAITCEAMRELRQSSQGSPEELQVLITIEE